MSEADAPLPCRRLENMSSMPEILQRCGGPQSAGGGEFLLCCSLPLCHFCQIRKNGDVVVLMIWGVLPFLGTQPKGWRPRIDIISGHAFASSVRVLKTMTGRPTWLSRGVSKRIHLKTLIFSRKIRLIDQRAKSFRMKPCLLFSIIWSPWTWRLQAGDEFGNRFRKREKRLFSINFGDTSAVTEPHKIRKKVKPSLIQRNMPQIGSMGFPNRWSNSIKLCRKNGVGPKHFSYMYFHLQYTRSYFNLLWTWPAPAGWKASAPR